MKLKWYLMLMHSVFYFVVHMELARSFSENMADVEVEEIISYQSVENDKLADKLEREYASGLSDIKMSKNNQHKNERSKKRKNKPSIKKYPKRTSKGTTTKSQKGLKKKNRQRTKKGRISKNENNNKTNNQEPVNISIIPALKKLYDQIVNPSDSLMIKSMSNQLPYLSGDSLIDEIITAAFIQARTSPGTAEEIFKSILRIRGDLPSARLGLGSILMNAQRGIEAVEVFSEMIRMNQTCSEGYRKRAEAYTALGQLDNALNDYNHAMEINPEDSETLIARSRINIMTGQHKRSLEDLLRVISIKPSIQGYFYLAEVYLHLGKPQETMKYLEGVLSPHASSPSLLKMKYLAAFATSRWNVTLKAYSDLLALDSRDSSLYEGRAKQHHAIGRPNAAIEDCYHSLELNPENINAMSLLGICLQSIGKMNEAVKWQTNVLQLDPMNKDWYSREVTAFWWLHLNDDFDSFNIDTEIFRFVRFGWLNSTQKVSEIYNTNYTSLVTLLPPAGTDKRKLVVSEAGLKLLSLTADIGRWVQLDCEGFMPNVRQHRMFGLSVLEMAQKLRQHVRLLQSKEGGGGVGLQVTDKSSSRSAEKYSASSSSKKGCQEGYHRFGYRDLLDIAIRWRQISEPMDAVFWFEYMPKTIQGFSLSTPLISEQQAVYRYFPNAALALKTMKSLMTHSYFHGDDNFEVSPVYPSNDTRLRIEAAESFTDLLRIVPDGIWVIVPVRGTAQPDVVLEGTRIVIASGQTEGGYYLAVHTPSHIERLISFEIELEAAFDRLVNELVKKHPDKKVVAKHGLELFYYWLHLTPLTRGTAATGYAVLLASIMASGHMIGSRMPKQRQLDWEAIFTTELSHFLANSGTSWVENLIPLPFSKDILDGISDNYLVSEVFSTPAKALAGIGKLLEDDSVGEEYPFVHNGEVVDKKSFWSNS